MDEEMLFDHDWDDKHIIDIEWDNPNHEADTEMLIKWGLYQPPRKEKEDA
jgi:hypothetical protein|tara:strand:- start:58 stop:207 length:150 start_codon:yes stop_codon:yes gene_type:complete